MSPSERTHSRLTPSWQEHRQSAFHEILGEVAEWSACSVGVVLGKANQVRQCVPRVVARIHRVYGVSSHKRVRLVSRTNT